MVLYKILELLLRLVQSDLEQVIFFSRGPDAILQLRLLVKESVPFLHEFDFVLSVGGFLRVGLPRIIHLRVQL